MTYVAGHDAAAGWGIKGNKVNDLLKYANTKLNASDFENCYTVDYMRAWLFPAPLSIGNIIIFEEMLHYTTVKTNSFNGISHPAIGMLRCDGKLEILREFGYEDYKNRMD